jgi:hypothetical protein
MIKLAKMVVLNLNLYRPSSLCYQGARADLFEALNGLTIWSKINL